MTVEEMYRNIGGDYASVKARLGTDELIERFLKKFLSEPSYNVLVEMVQKEDAEGAFTAAHTLKGVAANLSLMKLYETLSVLVEQLRGCDKPADKELMQNVTDRYQEVIQQIQIL